MGLTMRDYPAWAALTNRTLERPAVIVAFDKDGLPFDLPRS